MDIKKTIYKFQVAILAFLIVSAMTSTGWATTYYVDNTNGSDNNNGLSPSTAWETIAKINSSIFQPGDYIFFKAGEKWTEQLIAPSSGTQGNSITFGAYGIGAHPIIDAENKRPYGIISNGKSFIIFSELTIRNSASVGIYINFDSNNTSLIDITIENTVTTGLLVRASNFKCTRCTVSGTSGGVGIATSKPGTGSLFIDTKSYGNNAHGLQVITDDVTIIDGEFYNNGNPKKQGDGINILGGDRTKVSNVSSYANNGNGITTIFYKGDPSNGVIIENSEFHENNRNSAQTGWASGIRIDTNSEFTIVKNNRSYNNESGGIVVEDGANNNIIFSNIVYQNARGITHSNGAGVNNVYDSNKVYNNTEDGFQIFRSPNLAIIKNNAVFSNLRYGIYSDGGTHRLESNSVFNNMIGNIIGVKQ